MKNIKLGKGLIYRLRNNKPLEPIKWTKKNLVKELNRLGFSDEFTKNLLKDK